MIKTFLLLLLTFHVLGDTYLKQKEVTKYKNVIIKTFLYLLLFLIPYIAFDFNFRFLLLAIFVSFSNFILNTINYIIHHKNRFKHINDTHFIKTNLYFILQFIQICLIIYFTYGFYDDLKYNGLALWLNKQNEYLKWLLALLLVCKPSNIFFKQLFMQFKPTDNNETPIIQQNKTYKNAGAAIGTLERILILICLVNELYSSIGLILTAKSIARYNRISEDPEFSEYYLLGTLSSVLFTIIIYYVCFNLI